MTDSHITSEEHSVPDSATERVGNGATTISRSELIALALIVMVFVFHALLIIGQGAPFGHDESVYALRARDLARSADPLFYWRAYRAPGLPLLLAPLWLFRATEPYLRVAVTGCGVVLLISTWWLGRVMFSRHVGVIAAGCVSLTPIFISASTQVWPDIPGAALTSLTFALYAWALTQLRIARWVVVAVPLLVAAATLTRFGSPPVLALGLILLSLWRHESAVRQWKSLAAVAALSLVAVVVILGIPAATQWSQTSVGDSTAPFNAVQSFRGAGGSALGEGLGNYWNARTIILGGIPGLVLAVGIVSGVGAALERHVSRRALLTTLTAGILSFLVLGIFVLGEPRYLAPILPWFWVSAAAGLAYLATSWTRVVAASTTALIVIAWVASTLSLADSQSRFNSTNFDTLKSAARSIDNISSDYDCSVVSSYSPQVYWYSHCPTITFRAGAVVVTHSRLPDENGFLLLRERGKRQPSDEVLDGYLDETGGVLFTTGDPSNGPPYYVEVFRINSE